MRVLLDTCTFIWLSVEPSLLSATARTLLAEPETEVLLSPVSAGEISVKYAAKKLLLTSPPDEWVPHMRKLHGITSLELNEEATLRNGQLPAIHRDPFDRLLICQAITHGLTIATPDPLIRQYPIRTVW